MKKFTLFMLLSCLVSSFLLKELKAVCPDATGPVVEANVYRECIHRDQSPFNAARDALGCAIEEAEKGKSDPPNYAVGITMDFVCRNTYLSSIGLTPFTTRGVPHDTCGYAAATWSHAWSIPCIGVVELLEGTYTFYDYYSSPRRGRAESTSCTPNITVREITDLSGKTVYEAIANVKIVAQSPQSWSCKDK